jgi:hypothetical protein
MKLVYRFYKNKKTLQVLELEAFRFIVSPQGFEPVLIMHT